MSIELWIKRHEPDFGSPFERLFFINVLSKVSDLEIDTVETQYHFQDLDGKNRYCDFVIQEGSIKIAIEIDGYDKRGTGQGMSRNDFIDWQRRQAALTSKGWHVLRFANTDVSKEPQRCQRYIELLLRDQRSKSQHQKDLESTINQLEYQLKNAKNTVDAFDKSSKLQHEIDLLKKQLSIAQNAQPLSKNDSIEMEQIISRLEQEKTLLKTDNEAMKTAIWAFAAIIGMFILAAAYVFTHDSGKTNPVIIQSLDSNYSAEKNPERSTNLEKSNANYTAEENNKSALCNHPIEWSQAVRHIDKKVAVSGMVVEYRYMPNSKGGPTWINMGERYPSKNRLSIVIWGDNRGKFGHALSDQLVNRKICVIGVPTLRNGVPQITLKWPSDLIFQ